MGLLGLKMLLRTTIMGFIVNHIHTDALVEKRSEFTLATFLNFEFFCIKVCFYAIISLNHEIGIALNE